METTERPQDWIMELLVSSASTSPVDLLEEVMHGRRMPLSSRWSEGVAQRQRFYR
ncbi:MAG: hypothetical protein Q4B54_03790 [Coriobacteriales bacterium]|nr:hypothetical protein [Coriobacteriales bacterium]